MKRLLALFRAAAPRAEYSPPFTHEEIVEEVERRLANHRELVPYFESLGLPGEVAKTQQGIQTLEGVLKFLKEGPY